MAIAQYESTGCAFGGKMGWAAPNLFTLVRYSGMDSANNATEGPCRAGPYTTS